MDRPVRGAAAYPRFLFWRAFAVPGARWFLDDSFRDGELRVLNHWNRVHGIVVEGIYPIGKGLGVGIVTDPEQVADS